MATRPSSGEINTRKGRLCGDSGKGPPVLRDRDHAAHAGETGEVVITDLTNLTQPFLRYRIGDLAVATENFDKASVLADKDARVARDLARVANFGADVAWLDLRLASTPEAQRLARAKLDEAAPRARKLADDLATLAPDDLDATRARIDALRIAGAVADARALVTKIAGGSPTPDGAYALAMLDLAEAQPPAQYTEVLARLRLAAGAEGNAGRARAALVYALARSGDATSARAELDRLGAAPRPHPLLAALRAYVDHVPSGVDAGASAAAQPVASASPSAGATGSGGGGDSRSLLQQADDAKHKGDLDKAKRLFGDVVAKDPYDSEALAGLGEIAERQHDFAGAKTYYQQALRVNAGYLPARVGLGNVLWESGDKSGARKVYEDIVDSLPEGTYPSFVKERAQAAPAVPSASPAPSAKPASSDGPPAGDQGGGSP
jgi:tetratricopeptide (TPR) repeat protein